MIMVTHYESELPNTITDLFLKEKPVNIVF